MSVYFLYIKTLQTLAGQGCGSVVDGLSSIYKALCKVTGESQRPVGSENECLQLGPAPQSIWWQYIQGKLPAQEHTRKEMHTPLPWNYPSAELHSGSESQCAV